MFKGRGMKIVGRAAEVIRELIHSLVKRPELFAEGRRRNRAVCSIVATSFASMAILWFTSSWSSRAMRLRSSS